MTDLILVYITCASLKQAKQLAKHLLERRLCACINIFSMMQSMFFWPVGSGKISKGKEVVLILKTIESKYKDLEIEIQRNHAYETPCIITIPVKHVNKKYYDWLKKELET